MNQFKDRKIVYIIYIVIIVAIGLALISPFIVAIIFGGTLALTLFPMQQFLEVKGMQRKYAAGLLTLIFTLVLSVPFFFFVARGTIAITDQLQSFRADEKYRDQGVQKILQILKSDAVVTLHKYGKRLKIDSFLTDDKLEDFFYKANKFFLHFFQDFASALPVMFLLFLVMILCIYSFLKNASGMRDFFKSLLGFNDEQMDEIVYIFKKNSRIVYVSNIVTGGLQSLLVATVVAFMGKGDFFLVFFVTLILSFIPVIGAAPVAFAFALFAFFQEQTTHALVFGLLGGVTGVVDNILRPYLASFGESKIPPIASFICVIGGAIFLGFSGLFIGLLVGSIAYDTLPLFWNELRKTSSQEAFEKVLPVDQEKADVAHH